jgi:hypothetical protein
MTAGARRGLVIGAILALAAAVLVAWLASATQWQDVEVPRALTGKAALDDHYALERLAEALGTRTKSLDRLESLPPDGATLLLGSWSWDTFPERDRALREWVEHGGQLVMAYWQIARLNDDPSDDKLQRQSRDWIPVHQVAVKPGKAKPTVPREAPKAPDTAPAPPSAGVPPKRPTRLLPQPICRLESEAPGMAPAYADAPARAAAEPAAGPAGRPDAAASEAQAGSVDSQDDAQRARRGADPPAVDAGGDGDARADDTASAAGLRLCSVAIFGPGLDAPDALWGLRDKSGYRVVRVAVGTGTVTVVQDARIFDNSALLHGDNGLVDAAALQLRAGRELWIAAGDGRQPVLAWIWTRAPVAPLAALALLALWLWRALPRFGPREEPAATARRSMVEQIRGTARFLWQRSPGALHRAQRRALDETAARRIRDYARLDLNDRAEAIARQTGLERSVLLQALAVDPPPDRRSLPRQLALLEIARRSLLQEAPAAAPKPPDSNSHPWRTKP